MSEDWTGRTIDNRYVVEATLGSGGMGVVLRATHKYTGAAVALKMLRSHLAPNSQVQERFLAEARAPSAIGHPGIVQVLDAGRTPEGELYLAMELLEGVSLRDVVRDGLPHAEIRRIVLELLDALGAAHARGVVHRDLKPENVFLVGPQRTVKLLDFGIAKIVQSGPEAINRTSAGDLLGTLAYMAPEQLRDASKVDPRADLWAVGVMIYEMLSGRLPYRGEDLQSLYVAVLTTQPEPIGNHAPYVPAAWQHLLATALADPTRRFASAQQFAAAMIAIPIEAGAGVGVAVRGGGHGGPPHGSQGSANASWQSAAVAATAASGPGLPAPAVAYGSASAPNFASASAPGAMAGGHGGPPHQGAAPTGGMPISGPPSAPSAQYGSQAPHGASVQYGSQGAPSAQSQAQHGVPPTGVGPQFGSQAPHGASAQFGSQVPAQFGTPPPTGGMPIAGPQSAPYGAVPAQYGSAPGAAQYGSAPGAAQYGSAPGAAQYGSAPGVPAPHAKSKWPLALVAVAAIGGIVAIVAIMRGGGTPAPITPGSGSTVVVNVPVPTGPDATVADPWNDTSREAAAAACAKGCASLNACDLDYTTCVFDCARIPDFVSCFAAEDCTERASCLFGKTCSGTRPEGTATCGQVAVCQGTCNGDVACGCRCLGQLRRTQTILLFQLDTCAGECNFDLACTNRECQDEIVACRNAR